MTNKTVKRLTITTGVFMFFMGITLAVYVEAVFGLIISGGGYIIFNNAIRGDK
jgi:hypothetical protein